MWNKNLWNSYCAFRAPDHFLKGFAPGPRINMTGLTSSSSSSKLSSTSSSLGAEGSSPPPMERVCLRDDRSDFRLDSAPAAPERGGRCRQGEIKSQRKYCYSAIHWQKYDEKEKNFDHLFKGILTALLSFVFFLPASFFRSPAPPGIFCRSAISWASC